MSGESPLLNPADQESPDPNSLAELAASKDVVAREEDMEVKPEAPAHEVSASEILTLVLQAPLQDMEPEEAPEEPRQPQVPEAFVCMRCPVQCRCV